MAGQAAPAGQPEQDTASSRPEPSSGGRPKPKVYRSYVVLRQWDDQNGLRELRLDFNSLDELYALCIGQASTGTDGQLYVERMVLEGESELEHPETARTPQLTRHTLTFTFQSLSARDRPGPSESR